jgi:ankyrin repeat protein
LASDTGHVEVVKLLLEKSADMSVASNEGWTPLSSASRSGNIDVVKLLLKKGADVTVANIGGWTPLYLASDGGHLEVVKLLLEKGAEADSKHPKYGRTALSYAAGNRLEGAVVLRAKHGCGSLFYRRTYHDGIYLVILRLEARAGIALDGESLDGRGAACRPRDSSKLTESSEALNVCVFSSTGYIGGY